jgi:hypothetical protein
MLDRPPDSDGADGRLRLLASSWPIVGTLGVIYLAVATAGRLGYALPRLVLDIEPWSALDLKYRHNEVLQWFAGQPVYGVVDGAVYPPASHVILWPLLGWLPLDSARLLWAATTLLAAAALAAIAYELCRGAATRDRLLIAGLAFASYPLQMAVFVGQMGVHVAAFAAGGAFLLFHGRRMWWTDALSALLLAASLVKPTLSLPLVVGVLLVAGRWRPMLLTAAAYAALTLGAAAAQPDGLVQLMRAWLAVASVRVPVLEGVPNLHLLLARAGLNSWMSPASLAVLVAMSIWMWRRRHADPWLLLGAASIVARFWAHSTLYDDALLLLAAVALARTAFFGQRRQHLIAAGLLALVWAALLTPTWAYYNLGASMRLAIHAAQALLWLAVLLFLGAMAAVDSRSTRSLTDRRDPLG